MDEVMEFPTREAFRKWLDGNSETSDGVWLIFGKKGGPRTLTAAEALEEALCFGWIDGQLKSLGDTMYKKYFARRKAKSVWSEKNRKLAEGLISQGKMTKGGIDAVELAKKSGTWEAGERVRIEDSQIDEFERLIVGCEPAYSNFLAMSASIKKTYMAFYLDAKTDSTRKTRLEWIIDKLNRNLKPM